MYSKMPAKRKISIFFGFGWPSKDNYVVKSCHLRSRHETFLKGKLVLVFINFYHFCSFQKCQCLMFALQTSYVTNCFDGMGLILYKSVFV